MPATKENILVMIEDLETKIRAAESRGEDATTLREQLQEARSLFASRAAALNEGTNLLKG